MDQHEHGGDEVVVDDSEVGGLIDLEYELERLIEQDLVEGDALAESLCVDDLNDVEQDVPEREHSEQEDEDEQASAVIHPARVEVLEEAFSMCKVQEIAIASAYTKASDGVPLKNGCISLVVRNASDGAGRYAQFVH